MELSIIIANWNSLDFLKKCLISITSKTIGIIYEVIVIDSGSFDGSADFIQKNYPRISFIQAKENIGFAKANNIAFEKAGGDYLLFLNPDTEIEEDAIVKLLSFAKRMPNCGIVGARLLNSDRTVQTSCIQAFPTIVGESLDSDFLRRRFQHWQLWGSAALFCETTAPSKADVISGACMLMKKEVFVKVSGFCEDFFMYSEDVDLCRKALSAGFCNYFLPDAIIIHHGGASSSRSPVSQLSTVMLRQSRLRYFCKYKGSNYAGVYRISVLIASILRLCFLVVPYLLCVNREARDRFRLQFLKWRFVLRWSVGLESWACKFDGVVSTKVNRNADSSEVA